MSLSKEIEKLKYDKRLTDWNISRGKISKEEWQKHLASLPDSGDNVDNLSLAEESGSDSDAGDQQ